MILKKAHLLLLVFGLLAITVSWRIVLFLRDNWAVETPTCIQYIFAEKNVPMTHADQIISTTLEKVGVKQAPTSDAFARFGKSQNAWVLWDYPSHMLDRDKSRLRICQANQASPEWETVAKALESALSEQFLVHAVQINRNSSLFKCFDNCIVKVQNPVDFEKLHQTVLMRK